MNKTRDQRPKTRDYKKILIIRLDRIGDVLLSTPAIKALRNAYPESYIAFMVRPYAKDVVKGNPYLDDVIIYDKDGSERGIIGNLKFIFELRKKRFDLAIVLHPTNRTHLITYLAGIPERVGYNKKMGFLLTRPIPHTKQFGLKHEIDYTLEILRYIGIEPKERTLYMPVSEESERRIKETLTGNGVEDQDPLITIHPGASCPSKRWATGNFSRVADALADRYNAKIVVISSPKEKMIGDEVANHTKASHINLSGATTVSDIASILRRSKLLISNDSGPVHIACSVGTPVIAIFGRNDRGLSPVRWGPSTRDSVVLHKDVGCDFCSAHNCKLGFKCLEAITAEEVLAAAKDILVKR